MSVGESKFDGINSRRAAPDGQGHLVECLVFAVEGNRPRRPWPRRADDQPRPGLDQPATPTISSVRRRAPTRATRSRSARSSSCRGASMLRRSSASARRCRCTTGTATTSTPTASATTSFPTAYQFTGVDDNGVPSLQGDRRVRDRQLRTRRGALAVQPARVEGVQAAGRREHRSDRRRVQPLQRDQPDFPVGAASASAFFTGTAANHVPNTVFMKPTLYAGDAGQPEQRVAQFGFRFTF